MDFDDLTVSDPVIASTPTNAATPSIDTQPQDQTVNVGSTASLSVAASGGASLSYQWYSNSTNSTVGATAISGANSATYTAPTATAGTVYYYCVVTNTDSSATGQQIATATTNFAKVQVNALTNAATPSIDTQPQDQTINVGAGATLTVAASGGASLSYQWYSNSTNSTVGATAISGANSATYTAPTATAGTVYYYCVVTNTDSSATGQQTATATTNFAKIQVNALANAETPTANPAGGTVSSGTRVVLSTSTSGATIYYTIDGSTPTSSSSVYSSPITVSSNMTIKAIAVKTGMIDSVVMSKSYTITATAEPEVIPVAATKDMTWDAINIYDEDINLVGKPSGADQQYYKTAIQFKLPNLSGKTITKATLRLNVESVVSESGIVPFIDVYGSTVDTWGVVFPLKESDQKLQTVTGSSLDPGEINIDVTSFVQGQKDGIASFALLGNDTVSIPGNVVEIAISADTAATGKPQLILETQVAPVQSAPTVTTDNTVTNLTSSGATVGGEVTGDGNDPITERGIVYATSANPTTSNTKVTTLGTTGTFSVNLTGLSANTSYHYRAYATNGQGTSYGTDQTFTTSAVQSTLNPTSATFDKYDQAVGHADVTTTITPNGNTLSDVTLSGTSIGAGNYSYDSTSHVLTLKKAYLATLGTGAKVFTVDMNAGTDPTMTVTISDTTPQNSALNPTSATFDKYDQAVGHADVTTTITPNGNTLSDVTLSGTSIGAGNYSYDSTSHVLTLKKAYLATLGTGAKVFTVDMNAGADPTMTVTISDTTPQNSALNPTSATFDKYDQAVGHADVTTTITPNGNTLSDVTLSGTSIGAGNYSYDSTSHVLTLKKAYLATLGMGAQEFTVDMNAGTDPTMTVTISDTTPAAPDTTAPTVGNSGTITASNATQNSVDLGWTAATDTVTSTGNLKYKVVYSPSNNLDTVANAEANGTVVQDWTANITSATVNGLTAGTIYYFNVLVKDEAGNKALYSGASQATTAAPDTTPPTVGNSGIITASNATQNSVDLGWTAATDTVTSPGNLQYKVVYSTSNNLDTVTHTEANGAVGQDWTANITSATVNGLSAGTTYYFNVLVKDEGGNKALYNGTSQATAAAPDTTAPTVGNSGTITASNATQNSVDLGWTAATDTVTSTGNLKYKVVYSPSNNLDTVANAEANGTVVQDWATNITRATASGLNAGTTYYFNVLVKDEAGNKVLYSGARQTTTAIPTQIYITVVEHLGSLTDIPSGTPKTAAALGLPEKVAITLSDGSSIQAIVDWDLSRVEYDPTNMKTQIFTVYGTLVDLPNGVSNTQNLRASIQVRVNGKEKKEIVAITQPATIQDVENGTPKTAKALGLPEMVEVKLDDNSTREMHVNWDLEESSYDPDDKKAQTFSIIGIFDKLPVDIDNPKHLTASIRVRVNAAVEGTRNIVAITNPSAITELPNGTPKTATALELPKTVQVTLDDDSTMQVRVKWDVEGASYDPTSKEAQSFFIIGILTLPDGATNTGEKTAKIRVSVNADDGQKKHDIVDVINPDSITGLENGTAKTAHSLGLQKKVRVVLDDESTVLVTVNWDVDRADYDPDVSKRQKFTVDGTLMDLPAGVTNSHNKTVQVSVTVEKAQREDNGHDNDGDDGGSSHNHAGDTQSSKLGADEQHETTRQAVVEAGNDNSLQEQVEITRQINESGAKVDTVVIEANHVKEILTKASQHGKDVVRIVVDDLPNDPADKVAVKFSKVALDWMKKQGVSLEIKTEKATITIPKEMVANLPQNELYFEVVPIKNSSEVTDAVERVGQAAEVLQAANGQEVQIIGKPMTIETNYHSIPTKVVFPLDENTLPKQPEKVDAFLASLAVFVEHTDGEKELKRGQAKYDEKGHLTGFEIEIDKFSIFTILSINAAVLTDPNRMLSRAEVAYELAKIIKKEKPIAFIPLADVQETHWAVNAIKQVSSTGLMVGDGHGQFHPDRKVTRAEMATIIAKWKQISVNNGEVASFSDTKGHWAVNIIEAVRKQGILKGYADGSFRPDQGITQKELTILLQRLAGSNN
ncbi:hypothetical protein EDM56_09995 [Brevibacillus fluminis]|uniref:S-layer homology domain-containing protein n=1 Tax=Brevibacillus fluminis TaxID=511487 RepID=A0A3M8DRA9_9BACL|nr:X2-like carbohydrate binding domain-containing protein [Brevibacillus fluminis]RNB89517.1 hypothetical protein EDM56_09995 [Brevibacillus fluminis]